VTGDNIALFTLRYVNQEFQKTSGLDFDFGWRFGSASDWGVGLGGTYVSEYELTSQGRVFDGVGSYNGGNFGFEMPELRANLRLDWARGDHQARAVVRHISKLEEDLPNRPLTEEKAFDTLDLLYEYALPSGRSTLTFAVLNATDEEDPIREGDLRTVTSFVYDLRGRMYRLGFNWGL
jgi:outer membrane receptor protein involved in Fe transport